MGSLALVFCLAAWPAAPAPFAAGPGQETYVSELIVEPIPYDVVFRFDRSLPSGRMKKTKDGSPGTSYRMVQRTMRGGEVLRTRVLWERRIEPVPAVIVVGRPTRPVSRGSYTRMRVLEMEATAYCPNSCCGSGNPKRTAIGMRAGPGVVAVDPQVIPLRTVLFIEGYGLAVAGDTGGAIKGLRVDLGFATHAAALKFGRRKVRVHVLGKA